MSTFKQTFRQKLNNITRTNPTQKMKPNIGNLPVETEHAISLLKENNQVEKVRSEAAHAIKN